MNGVYGGLICVIWYGGTGGIIDNNFYLITQNNIDIYTQTSQNILVQE